MPDKPLLILPTSLHNVDRDTKKIALVKQY